MYVHTLYVTRVFADVDVDAELMGPTSLELLDGFRGESLVDVPNWQNDLMDELLGDPELSKPENVKKLPQNKNSMAISGKGQGKTSVESQPGTPSKAAGDCNSVLTSPR